MSELKVGIIRAKSEAPQGNNLTQCLARTH
jgi:hypothetical protein